MELELDWPLVDARRTRLSEGWCPAQAHPRLALLEGAGTCPRCGLVWRLADETVVVTLPD